MIYVLLSIERGLQANSKPWVDCIMDDDDEGMYTFRRVIDGGRQAKLL